MIASKLKSEKSESLRIEKIKSLKAFWTGPGTVWAEVMFVQKEYEASLGLRWQAYCMLAPLHQWQATNGKSQINE